MPGYIKMKLQEYEHVAGTKRQNCPYSPEGTEAQAPRPLDSSPRLNAKGIKCIQQIVGSILYYARAVDMTVLMALILIAVIQTNTTEKNQGPMHPIIGLPLWPLECKCPISRIGHGIKHTFRRVVYLRSKSMQPCIWGFFYGMDAKEWGAYLYEWGVSHQYNNLAVCCCIRSQSRAWSPLPQLSNGHYLSTHLGQNGPSTVKNPSTLWQHYSSWHLKQHYQASAFQIYGIEIFLDWRQSGLEYVRPETRANTTLAHTP